jgi:hypothetical protein
VNKDCHAEAVGLMEREIKKQYVSRICNGNVTQDSLAETPTDPKPSHNQALEITLKSFPATNDHLNNQQGALRQVQ